MPDAPSDDGRWRGIDELAGLVGTYCWVEDRIFEVTGAWATGPARAAVDGDDPALRVWCAAVSRRHGLLAAQWAERLPVRAGVDRGALATAPAGPLAGALASLAGTPDIRVGVDTLVLTVFPRLRAIYAMHRRTASPVSEGSVLDVLTAAHQELTEEIASGRALLQATPERAADEAALGKDLERAFAETSVFPAVSPS